VVADYELYVHLQILSGSILMCCMDLNLFFDMTCERMQILRHAFALNEDTDLDGPLNFHKFVHMASST